MSRARLAYLPGTPQAGGLAETGAFGTKCRRNPSPERPLRYESPRARRSGLRAAGGRYRPQIEAARADPRALPNATVALVHEHDGVCEKTAVARLTWFQMAFARCATDAGLSERARARSTTDPRAHTPRRSAVPMSWSNVRSAFTCSGYAATLANTCLRARNGSTHAAQ